MKTIDFYTTTSAMLQMMLNDVILGYGTCFFWKHENQIFLVTNWHNITGKDANSGQIIHSKAVVPNKIMFDLWIDKSLNNRGQGWIILEGKDASRWLIHPEFGQTVDVVCVPLPAELGAHVFPINDVEETLLGTHIADDLFILGYPGGIEVERLPIWKRASVATEPDFDIDALPKLYVDTASTKGMSGSPVIRRSSGTAMLENGSVGFGPSTHTRFVGIYSGRVITNNSIEAQLGVVWKARVIDEILTGKRYDIP